MDLILTASVTSIIFSTSNIANSLLFILSMLFRRRHGVVERYQFRLSFKKSNTCFSKFILITMPFHRNFVLQVQ